MSQRKTPLEKALAELSKFQSARDFTRGLKKCEEMLKKDPKCSEALGYKAYFTYLKDKTKKDETIKMARQANLLNMSSAQTWRICGLLYKEQNDFKQFYQSFKMANMKDPKDIFILSELCNIYFFYSNYDDFLTATRNLVQQNASSYGVMRYALGLYYTERYEDCDHFLNVYQSNWKKMITDEEELVFRSEFCLFRVMVFLKMEKFQDALKFIDDHKDIIRDTVKLNDFRIKCYEGLKDNEQVLKICEEQIKLYPEDGDYFDVIEKIKTKEELIPLFIQYKDQFKSKYAHVRALELMDAKDPQYEPLLREYLEPLILKAAPAAYQTIKDLSDEGIDIAFRIVSELKTPINCVPIVKLFRANVYYRKHDYEHALEEVNAGIEHTTTAIELLVWKAKFLRNIGRSREAMKVAKELRRADPADRSSNLLYVQTLLLNGMRKSAESEAEIFAGEENGRQLLFDTQFNTYYLRAGFAHLRALDYAKAREMYEGIFTHFDNYRIGEYNYIGWASKKPRALVELTDYLAILEREKQFYTAASFALRLAFYEKRADKFLDKTLQSMKSLNPETLALCCHSFLENKAILPAIRCWVKIGDSPYRYLALPALKEIVKLEMPPIVKGVVDEYFKAPETEPSTYEELIASAEGKSIRGDKEGAKKDLEQALTKSENIQFKHILKLYTIVQAFFDGETSKVICPEIENKFPQFEFKLLDEEKEIMLKNERLIKKRKEKEERKRLRDERLKAEEEAKESQENK